MPLRSLWETTTRAPITSCRPSARPGFASSVGVETFRKTINVVSYTDERLRKTAGHIIALAEAEGLNAHANAIRVRRQ